MITAQHPLTYTAYLLRCWLEGSTWRYSLQEVGADKRIGFASLDEFVSFLVARSMPADGREKPSVNVIPPEAKREEIEEANESKLVTVETIWPVSKQTDRPL